MLPVIAGVAYEFLKLLAKSECLLARILRWPGMQLQRLTTAEPTDEMMEVAILAFETALGEKTSQELAELKERFSHAKGGGQEEALHGKEKEYGAEEQEGGILGSSEPGEEPAPKGADVPEQTWETPLA